MSRPAAVASQEAVLAENAALRAQLAAIPSGSTRRGPARRSPRAAWPRAAADVSAGLGREPRRCVGASGATGRAEARGAARPSGVPARVRGPGRDGRPVPRVAQRARGRARGPLPRPGHRADAPGPPGCPRGHAGCHQRFRSRPGDPGSPADPGTLRVAARGPRRGGRRTPVLRARALPGLAAPQRGGPGQGPGGIAPGPPGVGEPRRARVGVRVPRLSARPRAPPVDELRDRAAPSPGPGPPPQHPRPGDGSDHPHRHRGPHGHRERTGRAPLRDAGGRERGSPPGGRHQQHAVLLGARPERGGPADRGPARARPGRPHRRVGPPLRADQHDGR